MKNEFNFEEEDESKITEMTKFAKKAIKCFKNYKPNSKIRPVLAIIGCKLLRTAEKEAITKLFRILDSSGDGYLKVDEITTGLKKLCSERDLVD